MKNDTRQKFAAMLGRLAAGYGVQSVAEQFSIAPSIVQLLKDKIVEQSTFLPRINVITVDELKGENILGSASGPVTGRTDTSGESYVVECPEKLVAVEFANVKLKTLEGAWQ